MIPLHPPPRAARKAVFFRLYFLEYSLTHPIVMQIVLKLDANLLEAWAERAAILEFEAGVERDLAEALALILIIRQFPHEVLGFLR